MKLIVGLGNPGKRYAGTRHNIGRSMVEFVAGASGLKFSEKKTLKASVAKLQIEGEEIILAFPGTYMNLSGEAVARLVRYFEIAAKKDLLVVVDDLDLPLAQLRLRAKGSCGGHNGLRSIQEQLGTNEFARLRIGVGHPGKNEESPDVAGYVLSVFDSEELAAMKNAYETVREACLLWVFEPVQKAMASVNHCK